MLYTEDFNMRHYVGFSQIGSQLYCKSSVNKTWHKRTAVASMFQNGISRNTKCTERDSFRREGHKLYEFKA